MPDRFPITTPPERIFGRVPAIPHRPPVVSPALEVQGQFRRYLSPPVAIGNRLALTDAAMEVHPPPRRHPLVPGLLIQRVNKTVARCHCPVWPFADPTRPQELSAPHQSLAAFLHLSHLCC